MLYDPIERSKTTFTLYINMLSAIDGPGLPEVMQPYEQERLAALADLGLVEIHTVGDLASEWLEPIGLTDLGRQLLYACRNETFVNKITDWNLSAVIALLLPYTLKTHSFK